MTSAIAGSLVDELGLAELSDEAVPLAFHDGPVQNLEMKAIYDKEPKRRVGPFEDGEVVQLNGVAYIIAPDAEVRVPESVWAVLENKRVGERYVRGINKALEKRAKMGAAAAVEYIR